MGPLELAMIAAIASGTALVVAFGFALIRLGIIGVPDPSRRIGCMDGLRGFLASGVMIHHFAMWLGLVNEGVWRQLDHSAVQNFGSAGVSLFFMVSGALFYGRVRGRAPGGIDWRSLYVSRIFRIMPLLLLAVACVIVISLARGADPSTFRPIAALRWVLFLGMPDIFSGLPQPSRMEVSGVIWTLRYEWAFYALLPLVALAFARPSPATRLALTAGLTVALAASFMITEKIGLFGYFAAGAAAVEVTSRPALKALALSPAAAVIGLAALAGQLFFTETAYATLPLFLLLIFFVPVLAGNSYFGLLALPGSLALGELSYGIYLLHGLTLSVMALDLGWFGPTAAPSTWAALPAAMIAVTVVAALGHKLIEVPFIRLGRTAASRLRGRLAVAR